MRFRRRPTISEAREQYEQAQRREFRNYLPASVDMTVYPPGSSNPIRCPIILNPDGTWEEQ